MDTASTPPVARSSGYSVWGWILQALSGIGLLVLLSLHLMAQHFIAPGGVRNYDEVVAYLKNPAVFALETMLAAFVLYHAFAGVRAILMDLGLSQAQGRLVSRVLIVLAAGLWLYGLALTLVVVRR